MIILYVLVYLIMTIFSAICLAVIDDQKGDLEIYHIALGLCFAWLITPAGILVIITLIVSKILSPITKNIFNKIKLTKQ